jgi:SAM-dependent methyltransferase
MSENKKKSDHIWEFWPEKKHYNKPHLELYYHIRRRNLKWLTALSLSFLAENKHPRILKTDLWNEAKKDDRFFVDANGQRVGIDLSNSICKMTKARYADAIPLAQGSIDALPFLSGSFDIIWDISTIDHFGDPEKVLKEYNRVLKPGGVLLMISENPFCLSYPVTKLQSFVGLHVPFKGFLPARMLRACREGGLQVIDNFKTNVHLPAFIVYPLERNGRLEEINQGRNIFWDLCKKYFVVLARKS